MQLFYTVFAFIIALGILVIVHEFGHYWTAKKLGVKVLRFSIGFGKSLWTRRVGTDETEIVVAALPLGGYVKMLDENEGPVAEHEKQRAFNRQSIPRRSAIVIAGPLFNFIFAILAYWFLYVVGVDDIKPLVGKVAQGSIAETAGFKPQDELLAIDGRKVIGWNQHRLYLLSKALSGETISVNVRDVSGMTHTRVLDLSQVNIEHISSSMLTGGLGLYPDIPELLPVIGVVEDGPAKDAGMLAGDRVIKINDKGISRWIELVDTIQRNPDTALNVVVDRGGKHITFDITPMKEQIKGKNIGRINVRPQIPDLPADLVVIRSYNPVYAMWHAAKDTWMMSILTLHMLYKMIKLEVSTRNISGPITIAQYAGVSVQVGLDRFLMFLAVVSISLGILNLLPIPVLDGGHLMYYCIEAVKGSPVSDRVMALGQQVGILLLIGLMILAFYNDISRIFQ